MTGILQQIMSTMEQTRSASVLDSVSMIGFAALLVLGVINCVLGYRLLRFWMMLFGFPDRRRYRTWRGIYHGNPGKIYVRSDHDRCGHSARSARFSELQGRNFYYRCRYRTGTWNLCFPSDDFSGIFLLPAAWRGTWRACHEVGEGLS